MQVQTSHVYTPPNTPVARPAADDAKKATPSATAPAATEPATTNAVTGTTGSNLSAETTAALLESSQQASTSDLASSLSKASQHGLDAIANDPTYAKKRAEILGTAPELLVVHKLPGTAMEMSQAFAMRDDLAVAFKQREAVYNSKTAEGLSPAQVYAEMLAFQINQSEHNARADIYQGDPVGTRTNRLKAEHAYLKQAIIDANSTGAASQQVEELGDRDKGFMREIANNPAVASRMARAAGGGDLMHFDLSSNTMTAADKALLIPLGSTTHPRVIMLNKRETMAASELKQGLSAAEVYQHVLEFNAKLPESYGNSLDQTGQTPPGAWNKHQQAMADYLKQAIADANSTEVTG